MTPDQPKPKGRGWMIPFSKDYEEACFAIWYKAGKPSLISQILNLLPKDDQGRSPSKAILEIHWIPNWKQRADVLDAESSNILDKNLIEERVQMLEKQAEQGKRLQEMGMKFFDDHDLKDEAVALRMIVQGVEIERNSRGLSVALQRISSMSDETLQNELNKQLARYKESQGEIIDGDISDTEPEREENA
jgi:hypothetical protein